jgi:hypothetical protein
MSTWNLSVIREKILGGAGSGSLSHGGASESPPYAAHSMHLEFL